MRGGARPLIILVFSSYYSSEIKHKMKTIVILATTLLLAYVVAECPNGCSGQGTCSSRDMCNCDKNYHGNDCSLKACPNAYAFIDTPKGDLNMDAASKSSWELTNSQLYPAGGYEFMYPSADNNEGHWYMECANRGLCDSETGTCQCFDGYEGAACQRTVCPNDCSGHGVCESISELSSNQNTQLFHKDTYHGAQTYTLWDKKTSYGCKCDPWFYGADCSKRRCKVGVDPMYEAVGQEIIETILIRVGFEDDGTEVLASGYVRIKFWDYWGEAYHTARIDLSNTAATSASNIQAGLLALPNGVITDVTCADSATTTTVDNVRAGDATSLGTTNWIGHIVGCKLTSNPGSLRLPTVDQSSLTLTNVPAAASSVVLTGSSKRGEDIDYCGTLDSVTVTSIAADATAVVTSGTSDLGTITLNTDAYLVKIKDQYVAVNAHASTSMTMMYAWGLPAISAATTSIFYSTTKMLELTQTIATWTIGATSFTASADPSGTISAGDILFTENQIFTIVSISTTTVTVDRPYSGNALDGGSLSGTVKVLYWLAASVPTSGVFTYVSECSGRGICESESGVCQCFKGYTNDNCDTQNILAF